MSAPSGGRLLGARVLVTRAREQAGVLTARLQGEGATPVLLPAIRFVPPSDLPSLHAAARSAGERDYFIFTSANGVRGFLDALAAEGMRAAALARGRFYAVGAATAAALRAQGLIAEDLPARERSAGLEELLRERASPHERGLLVGPESADGELLRALRAAGLLLDAVAAYRTVSGADQDAARAVQAEGPVDAALFYSPSAVRGTTEVLSAEYLRRALRVAVGPTTAEALRRAGLPPDAVAKTPSDEEVVEALCKLWRTSQREAH